MRRCCEWPKVVRSAILHVVGLAHMALTYSRSWAANSPLSRVRLQAALDVARTEVAVLTEELRIPDDSRIACFLPGNLAGPLPLPIVTLRRVA